jgi:hypothetical protein
VRKVYEESEGEREGEGEEVSSDGGKFHFSGVMDVGFALLRGVVSIFDTDDKVFALR